MEEPGERSAEELEIVNRQLSSFILVDGSIYLLPPLFVICAGVCPAVTAFALFTAVGWNSEMEGEKSCFRINVKGTGEIGCVLTGTRRRLQCREIIFHLASSRHETTAAIKTTAISCA